MPIQTTTSKVLFCKNRRTDWNHGMIQICGVSGFECGFYTQFRWCNYGFPNNQYIDSKNCPQIYTLAERAEFRAAVEKMLD